MLSNNTPKRLSQIGYLFMTVLIRCHTSIENTFFVSLKFSILSVLLHVVNRGQLDSRLYRAPINTRVDTDKTHEHEHASDNRNNAWWLALHLAKVINMKNAYVCIAKLPVITCVYECILYITVMRIPIQNPNGLKLVRLSNKCNSKLTVFRVSHYWVVLKRTTIYYLRRVSRV